jgi:hypothetical protein
MTAVTEAEVAILREHLPYELDGVLAMYHPNIPPAGRINRHLMVRLATIVTRWANVEALLAEFLSYLLKADPGKTYILNQEVASSTQLKWISILAEDQFTQTAGDALQAVC